MSFKNATSKKSNSTLLQKNMPEKTDVVWCDMHVCFWNNVSSAGVHNSVQSNLASCQFCTNCEIRMIFLFFKWLHFKWLCKYLHNSFNFAYWPKNPKILTIRLALPEKVCQPVV